MYRIMIVEDDDKIAEILGGYVAKYGYEVFRARDLKDLKREFVAAKPSLVILDINLPYYDGFYWCRQLRTISTVPIIFLSARSENLDQVRAIEHGGDDYITKPFSLEVVMAKIQGALRRAYGEYALVPESPEHDVYEIRGLFLNRNRNEVQYGHHKAVLSKNEFLLLDSLARDFGHTVSREDLLEALWDDVEFVDDNTLTVNVSRVRKKLASIGIKCAIETVRGQGYRLSQTWGSES